MRSLFVRETRKNFFSSRLLLFVILVFCSLGGLMAQEKTVTYIADPACIPPDLPISIKHLDAHICFNPEKNLVVGTAEFTFIPNRNPVDSIVFNTPDFIVSSVKIHPIQSLSQFILFGMVIYLCFVQPIFLNDLINAIIQALPK